MKFHKYIEALKANPDLNQILCSTPYDVHEYVTDRLRYIAYRPFKSLNMFEREHCVKVSQGSYSSHFWVYFKIGEETLFRARSTFTDIVQPDVMSVMKHLQQWYNNCCKLGNFHPEKQPLQWKYVVKVNHLWFEKQRRWERGFEIYRFPEGYTF